MFYKQCRQSTNAFEIPAITCTHTTSTYACICVRTCNALMKDSVINYLYTYDHMQMTPGMKQEHAENRTHVNETLSILKYIAFFPVKSSTDFYPT